MKKMILIVTGIFASSAAIAQSGKIAGSTSTQATAQMAPVAGTVLISNPSYEAHIEGIVPNPNLSLMAPIEGTVPINGQATTGAQRAEPPTTQPGNKGKKNSKRNRPTK